MSSHGSATSSSTGPNMSMFRVNSPIPYLFGGLALMLALIVTALVVLASSYRRYEEGYEESKPVNKVVEDDFGPKFAVIMPGKLVPTHIAKPKLILKHVPSNSVPNKFDDINHGDEQV